MVKPRPSTGGMTNKKGGPEAALVRRWTDDSEGQHEVGQELLLGLVQLEVAILRDLAFAIVRLDCFVDRSGTSVVQVGRATGGAP